MKNLCTLLLIILPIFGFGQVDSLIHKLSDTKLTPNKKTQIYISLASYYTKKNVKVDSAIFYAQKAYALAVTNNNIKQKAQSCDILLSSYSLKNQIDSAKFYYNKSHSYYSNLKDTSKVLELEILSGVQLFYNDNDKVLKIKEKLPKIRSLKDDELLGMALINLCQAYIKSNQISDESLQFAQESLILMKKRKDKVGICRSYNTIANMYLALKDIENGLDYLYKAIDYAKKHAEAELASIYVNGGNKFRHDSTTYRIAKDFYLEAKNIAIQKGIQNYYLGVINEGLADIAIFHEKKYAEGFFCLYENIALDRKNKDYYGLLFDYSKLGISYKHIYTVYKKENIEKPDYLDSSMHYISKAIDINRQYIGDDLMKLEMLYHLVALSWLKKAFNKSIEYALQVKEIATQLGDAEKLKNAYYWLATNNAEIGNYKKAYEYRLQRDSLEKIDIKSKMDSKAEEARSKFKVKITQDSLRIQQDSTKIVQLESDRQTARNTLLGSFLILVLIALVAIGILAFREHRSRKRIAGLNQIIDKQLFAVHHDSKNHLNQLVIFSKNYERDASISKQDAISKINHQLYTIQTLYQLLYEKKDYESIDIKEYLGKIALQLHDIYGSDEIKLSLDIQDATIERKHFINKITLISLLLNELMVNAYRHGFDEHCDNPELKVQIKLQKNEIWVQVMDNGKGIPKDKTEKFPFSHKFIENNLRMLNGRLNWTSTPYTNTTFDLFVPVN